MVDIELLVQDFWWIFFLVSIYFAYFMQFTAGMLIKMKEFDSKIRHFLLTNNGGKAAYLMSIVLLDTFIMLVNTVVVLVFSLVVWKGGKYFENISFVFQIILVCILQMMNNFLVTGYMTSCVFGSYKSFLTYQNFFSMAGFGIIQSIRVLEAQRPYMHNRYTGQLLIPTAFKTSGWPMLLKQVGGQCF